MDVILAYKWYEKINEVISANFLRELHESEEIKLKKILKQMQEYWEAKREDIIYQLSLIKYFTK